MVEQMSEPPGKEVVAPQWQVTATTKYCEIVHHQATIMVHKDWSVDCAYHRRWGSVCHQKRSGFSKLLAWLRLVSMEKQVQSSCPGPEECSLIVSYRDKLLQEEISEPISMAG